MKTFTTNDGEVITAAEQAAGIIDGTGKTEYVGITKVLSIRIPEHTARRIQALSEKSGKSRNATICTFLDVAIDEVEKHLSKEFLQELDSLDAASIGYSQGEE